MCLKHKYLCFSLCLEVDKRDDDPWDPKDPCRRWTEALNPSSFHCCLSQDPFPFFGVIERTVCALVSFGLICVLPSKSVLEKESCR